MNIFLGILLAIIYWSMTNVLLFSNSRWFLAAPKWSAAILTHTNPFAPVALMVADKTVQFAVKIERLQALFKWITISAYSVGDVALLWDESTSLPFFGVGHVAFVMWISGKDSIPGIAATVCDWIPSICDADVVITAPDYLHYVGEAHIAALITTTVVICAWLFRNGSKGLMSYAVYIYALSLAMFVGCFYQAYGVFLFVLSDAIIGFRIQRLKAFTYPLYYLSLLSYYFYVPA